MIQTSATEGAQAGFQRYYNQEPLVCGYAPGRVNIVGEHVDYNLGPVLPFAIGQRITVAASRQDAAKIDAYSALIEQSATFRLDVHEPLPHASWENYLRGMVHGLRAKGIDVPGARLWFGGTLLPGGGMSSSAALCVSTARALLRLANADLPGVEIVRIAQQAEHDFAGMPCGIMDQYASTFGREQHALLLNCQKMKHEEIPLHLNGAQWMVIPSGVEHALVDGAYEERVRQCAEAVRICQTVFPNVQALGELTPAQLEQVQGQMPETIAKRARHVVTEIARVHEMVQALQAGDATRVGELLWTTHESLRDDYHVSCSEVDALIDLLRETPGVYGARMVGGGFGGVLLALVDASETAAVAASVNNGDYAPRGVTAEILTIAPSAGAAVTACPA